MTQPDTDNTMELEVIPGREGHILRKDAGAATRPDEAIACDRESLAGAVSQRACVFCGARVVINPVADALHLIHGPIGCSTYTWDIRGALSSGRELHRLSFSTDLREKDVIFGGEDKLYRSLVELIDRHRPEGAFVYATCIAGVIGDDIRAVCARVEREKGLPVIAVQSEGFKGNKNAGYKAACEALFNLVSRDGRPDTVPRSVNILGDFNLAGELWIIRGYLEEMGLEVVANISGDSRVADIRRAPAAALNVVQCSGSMMHLARMMEREYGIPFVRVSWVGAIDTADSLERIAGFFADEEVLERAHGLINRELTAIEAELESYRRRLAGRTAAVYVGGAFKAVSLIRAFRQIGMRVAVVGSQTGKKSDYEEIRRAADEGAVIIDDANPLELAQLTQKLGIDIFVGGVKERPVAYKLGVAFCDHNHERKLPLEGFSGMVNFAREVYGSISSPVWGFVPRAAGLPREEPAHA
ncbi:MAG: nitrogenase iron-molybdenum cofactor biosynthesis protein NifE [Pseudomonadota bacterium]